MSLGETNPSVQELLVHYIRPRVGQTWRAAAFMHLTATKSVRQLWTVFCVAWHDCLSSCIDLAKWQAQLLMILEEHAISVLAILQVTVLQVMVLHRSISLC